MRGVDLLVGIPDGRIPQHTVIVHNVELIPLADYHLLAVRIHTAVLDAFGSQPPRIGKRGYVDPARNAGYNAKDAGTVFGQVVGAPEACTQLDDFDRVTPRDPAIAGPHVHASGIVPREMDLVFAEGERGNH